MRTRERFSTGPVRPQQGARPVVRQWIAACLTLLAVLSLISANDVQTGASAQAHRAWYVAPQGRADHDGSFGRPLDLTTALSTRSPAAAGDTIWLRGGIYAGAFTSQLTGTASAPIIVRQYPGERARLDGRGAPANTLTIRGAHTWFWGFEVLNSDPTRVYARAVNLDPDGPDGVRGVGVNIYGAGTRCINLVVHDTLGGFGVWESAIDAEIYGSLAYHNGVVDTVRGHGHGLYVQNRQGTKRIEDVISFGNFATGMKVYGEAGYAEGVAFDGVISFNNGVPSRIATELDKIENFFVGSTDHPADRISLSNSAFYHLPHVFGPNLTIGYQNTDNGAVVVQNNMIIGGNVALSVKHWRQSSVAGNTVLATTSSNGNADQSLVQLRQPAGAAAQWQGNRYIDGTVQAFPFTFNQAVNRYGGGNLSFDDWRRSSGIDATSSYVAGSPTGTVVRLRANRYEPGRGHLVVYNWDRAAAVSVNLGAIGLAAGDPFEIRDSQNYFGARILQGVYTGAPVSVPLTGTAIAQPIGSVLLPPRHTAPEFFAFVVLKLRAIEAPPARLNGSPQQTPNVVAPPVAAPASPSGALRRSGDDRRSSPRTIAPSGLRTPARGR